MPIELVNNWDVETYRNKLEKANTDQTHESDTYLIFFKSFGCLTVKYLILHISTQPKVQMLLLLLLI